MFKIKGHRFLWNKNSQRRGYKGTSTLLFKAQTLSQITLATDGTDLIFSGDALEHVHVDCAIHNLEKQSVVDVEDDDDDGNDDVVNAADDDDHDDDYGGNEEGTKNFGDNDED